MKSIIIVALALVVLAVAAPPEYKEPIPIVRSEFNQLPEGGYNFDFESGNGIARQENGEVKEVLDEEKKPHKVIVVRGSYSYPSPDGGEPEVITYEADENGYRAVGKSIPVPANP